MGNAEDGAGRDVAESADPTARRPPVLYSQPRNDPGFPEIGCDFSREERTA